MEKLERENLDLKVDSMLILEAQAHNSPMHHGQENGPRKPLVGRDEAEEHRGPSYCRLLRGVFSHALESSCSSWSSRQDRASESFSKEHLVKRVLWKTLRGSQREKPGDVLDENFEPADIGLDVTLGSAGRVCLM